MLKKEASSGSNNHDVLIFNQPASENKVLSEKVEELEGVQVLERDFLFLKTLILFYRQSKRGIIIQMKFYTRRLHS